jgi:hypothetical protein
VFKVVTAGCGQRGIQLGRPLLVGLSQPDTWLEVRRRSLSTALNGGPALIASSSCCRIYRRVAGSGLGRARAGSLVVAVPSPTQIAPAACVPSGVGAVRCVLHSGEGSEIIAPRDPTDGTPPLVRVHWPLRATTAAANHYPVVAATIVCIIAESAAALARYKAGGRR